MIYRLVQLVNRNVAFGFVTFVCVAGRSEKRRKKK